MKLVCRLDHWVSSDGLQWRHDQVLVPPYTDKAACVLILIDMGEVANP